MLMDTFCTPSMHINLMNLSEYSTVLVVEVMFCAAIFPPLHALQILPLQLRAGTADLQAGMSTLIYNA